jgi:hypothetical protein
VPGFIEAARRYVAHALAIAFSRAPRARVAEALRLEGKELDAYLAERAARDGWSVEGDIVVLPKSAHNTPAQKRAVEVVALNAVAPALMA